MEAHEHAGTEEVLRLLASAVNATRLYPSSSDLPAQALGRFIDRAAEVTRTNPIRVLVDPRSFRIGETMLAPGHTQTASLAETFHAMQVGQLVIAPGMTSAEARTLVVLAGSDPREVRSSGGARSALLAAGAANVAVIEVSLRASSEEGLPGVDLVNAPLDDIAAEALGAAQRWVEGIDAGTPVDEAARAIGQLEQATRDLASSRVATAMMRLTEEERLQILTAALTPDASGQPMQGMLDVIARMSPASLARLLRMAAQMTGGSSELLSLPLDLPPEVANEIAMLLAPSPRTDAECGIPEDAAVERIAAQASEPGGEEDIARLKSDNVPSRACRALSTTLVIVRAQRDKSSVEALGAALAPAARAGAFTIVREALRALDELSASQPPLTQAIADARSGLDDPAVLADVCHAVRTDADAAIAGELLFAAGAIGADALLTHYAHAGPEARSLMRPVLRGLSDQVVASAARRLRSDEEVTATGILRALPDLGERHALSVVPHGLEHLDVAVRRASVSTLASLEGPEARRALAKTLGHWDPETRRWAIREVGRVRAVEAIPTLVRILEDINMLERNHELKKEVIKCLESIGSREALPVLERWSRRKFMFGRKNKELRFLASRAVERLAASGQTGEESMRRD